MGRRVEVLDEMRLLRSIELILDGFDKRWDRMILLLLLLGRVNEVLGKVDLLSTIRDDFLPGEVGADSVDCSIHWHAPPRECFVRK